ncbi:DNA cytosine methyltransferase [Streptomyces sp. NPDC007991]|uniref:DNA cytosine methyltransferase n=1 Tax=Streptomyces sp. NPDC007991 TaxID=3364803 RepID=UPI0036EBFA0E
MAAFTGWAPQQKGLILDGCAGPGGWSWGIKHHLGLRDLGIEWDVAACATRRAAKLATRRADVSTFNLAPFLGRVWGLLFSPPCTKLSAAGNGIGRKYIPLLSDGIRRMFRGEDCREEVRKAIFPGALVEQRKRDVKRPESKRRSEEELVQAARDDAFVTALMLEPARYLHELLGAVDPQVPFEWVAFEQVPAAEPMWRVYAEELRRLGWSVAVGVLDLADYGGGQERPRAILVASSVREVSLPAKTHGKVWGHDLFGGQVLPQVTMAQALGWGYKQRPAPTVTGGGTATGGAEPFGNGSRQAMLKAMNNPRHWAHHRPAHTVSGTVGHVGGKQSGGHLNLDPVEGAILQTFPANYPFRGNKNERSRQIGDAVPPLLAAHVVSAASGVPFLQEALTQAA